MHGHLNVKSYESSVDNALFSEVWSRVCVLQFGGGGNCKGDRSTELLVSSFTMFPWRCQQHAPSELW